MTRALRYIQTSMVQMGCAFVRRVRTELARFSHYLWETTYQRVLNVGI
jgi:hypothetical protein